MGDHNHQPVLCYFLQNFHNLHAGRRIQGTGGLIRQQNIRVIDQCTGNGHPLHLPAGHLVGLFMQLIAQPHLLQNIPGTAAALLAGNPGQRQGQLHISQHGLMGNQVIALEYKTHRVVPIGIPVPVAVIPGGTPADHQIPCGILIEPANNVQQRGLSAAAGAQNGDKFIFPERYRNSFQRGYPIAAHLVLFYNVF